MPSASTDSSRINKFVLVLLCVSGAGLLAACGGSSEGEPTAASITPPTSPPPPPPPPGSGSVTLAWLPPTTYTDGSALTIEGYRFYAGPTQNSLTLVEDVKQPGLSSHVISGLGSGSWIFAVTVYDPLGVESSFSNFASKNL